MSGTIQKVNTPSGRKTINETSGMVFWDGLTTPNFSDLYASINGATIINPTNICMINTGHIFDAPGASLTNLNLFTLIGFQDGLNSSEVSIEGDFSSKVSTSFFRYLFDVNIICKTSGSTVPFTLTDGITDLIHSKLIVNSTSTTRMISCFGEEQYVLNLRDGSKIYTLSGSLPVINVAGAPVVAILNVYASNDFETSGYLTVDEGAIAGSGDYKIYDCGNIRVGDGYYGDGAVQRYFPKAVINGTNPSGITPEQAGDIYVDTNNSKVYVAKGNSSDADWLLLN